MKKLVLIIFIGIINPLKIFSQTNTLSNKETIDYINKILIENNVYITNHPITYNSRRIGNFFINEIDKKFGFTIAVSEERYKQTSYDEFIHLDLRTISLSKDGLSIIIKCDKRYMYVKYNYLGNNYPNTYFEEVEIKFENDFLLNKFFNALNYLIVQLQKNKDYVRKDPFENMNISEETARITISQILFKDENNNKRIDQLENAIISVIIENYSSVNYAKSTIVINEKNKIKGLNYPQNIEIENLTANKSKNANIKIYSESDLQTGEANFELRLINNNEEITKKYVKIATFNSGPQDILISKLPNVDIDIPRTSNVRKNSYAIVIGNEDYKSKQPNLSFEANVKYANNDAKIFKEYLNITLGIPSTNIIYLINATSAEIKQAINKVKQLPLVNTNADIIFYYAGHGLPDEKTKEQYLIPVDVNGANLSFGLKINEVISELASNNPKQVLLILDACFSGAGRNESLLSNRGVKVRPKENVLKNNTIIISSSSNEEASKAYDEMQHGMFTYYLLKKIQETKGNVDLKTLFDFVHFNVREKSLLINNQFQTPTIIKNDQINKSLNEINF